ncbi:4'-phosphopantetheinyl transferase family protein [Streptomyces sp. NPDC088768]|uniref:4'-phosphopantetheinyl transferase family protein n=1 Tax=Streptomyces sp. NPDC088768 TaxID=3365894 RepID=UPI003830EFBB
MGSPREQHQHTPPRARYGNAPPPGRYEDTPDAAAATAAEHLVAEGAAHVWWWRCGSRVDPADLELLSTEEFRRALSMLAERDAAEFVTTRARARRAIGALLGLAPEGIVLGRGRCPGCGAEDHGPPRLARPALPLAISLSRSAGWGVLALGAGPGIGVDAEALRPVGASLLTGSVLTEAERAHLRAHPAGARREAAFHRAWTRKEAVVKAVGVGLVGTALDRLETRPERAGPVRLTHHGTGRTTRWHVEDLTVDARLAVALARPEGPAARGPVHLHPPA